MERKRIKEAARLKIEWCCEVVPSVTNGLFLDTHMQDAIDAMHNAQATYVKYVHGPVYRGSGNIEPIITANGNFRITMQWVGSKNQAHFLHRRDAAFHAVGEEPKPLVIGLPVTTSGAISGDATPETTVAPIPASEGTGQAPEPGLEMQPPAEAPPKHDWPGSIFTLRKMARELKVDVSDIKGRGAYKKIIERLELRQIGELRTRANAEMVDVSDIEGKGTRQEIIRGMTERLEAAEENQSD